MTPTSIWTKANAGEVERIFRRYDLTNGQPVEALLTTIDAIDGGEATTPRCEIRAMAVLPDALDGAAWRATLPPHPERTPGDDSRWTVLVWTITPPARPGEDLEHDALFANLDPVTRRWDTGGRGRQHSTVRLICGRLDAWAEQQRHEDELEIPHLIG